MSNPSRSQYRRPRSLGRIGAALVALVLSACAKDPVSCEDAAPICGVSQEGQRVGFCDEAAGTSCRAVCAGGGEPACHNGGVVCVDAENRIYQKEPLCVPGGDQAPAADRKKAFADFACPRPEPAPAGGGAPGEPLTDQQLADLALVSEDLGGGRVRVSGCDGEATYACTGPYHTLICVDEAAPPIAPTTPPTSTTPPPATGGAGGLPTSGAGGAGGAATGGGGAGGAP